RVSGPKAESGAAPAWAACAARAASAECTQPRRRQRGSSGASVPYCTDNESSGDMVAGPLVGVDNAGHQRMAHDVAAGETCGGDALHRFEDVDGMHEAAGMAAGQVDLGGVAVDDGLAAETDAG